MSKSFSAKANDDLACLSHSSSLHRAVEQDPSLRGDPEAARDDPAALRPLQAGLGRPVRRRHDQPGRPGHGRLHHLTGQSVMHFVSTSAKFGICTVVSVNGTLVEDKIRRFKDECVHFSFNKCPIYTQDGASAKFSTISHETDNRD
jgi:hypothetical protein